MKNLVMLVACGGNANGTPTIVRVEDVMVTQAQFDAGRHYPVACAAVAANGYDTPYIAMARDDLGSELFDLIAAKVRDDISAGGVVLSLGDTAGTEPAE